MSLINTRALQLFTGMMITQISNLNGMCILFLNLIRMILTRMIVLFSYWEDEGVCDNNWDGHPSHWGEHHVVDLYV